MTSSALDSSSNLKFGLSNRALSCVTCSSRNLRLETAPLWERSKFTSIKAWAQALASSEANWGLWDRAWMESRLDFLTFEMETLLLSDSISSWFVKSLYSGSPANFKASTTRPATFWDWQISE